MKTLYKNILVISLMALFFVACHSDLELEPVSPNSLTELDVYENEETAFKALAKLYQSYATAGQLGGNDATTPPGPDIPGLSQAAVNWSDFVYLSNFLNDVSTDISVVAWTSPGIQNINTMVWTSQNFYSNTMYYRLAAIISFCNSFIENVKSLPDTKNVQYYSAEARYLRALAYYYMMDYFGNVPLVTQVSTELPVQNSRDDLFEFIETELLEVKDLLMDSGTNDYGRVDQVAAWALLSRLYLNAEVYVGENKYNDAVIYSELAINSTYTLNTTDANGNGTAYDELFLGDNNKNGAQVEFIHTINYDGLNTAYWGGATNLVHGYLGGSIDPSLYGVSNGWWGLRTTKSFVERFDYAVTETNAEGEPIAWSDSRAMFYTDGQTLEISDAIKFNQGYLTPKWSNLYSDGSQGSDVAGNWVDTDVPIFRLAEMYLNYAEATLRGGNGDDGKALQYINDLRTRAGASTITSGDLTLDFMIDERAREMYLECNRRTDLIRFGHFTGGDYLWSFKGGVESGKAVDNYRSIYPIPYEVLLANPNLEQNPGY
ncbi:RagB/SusD family nutrient uptake outer membrane protein [Marinilabilia rubra]|uniref:RagB/SusD family nutrient uptake outer membrane protein n=1 Tax=Marinilabilia rubra TaxID=2162893 RepID=A0A2U2BC25_9BACT|nr:RagB/SusD family nutrient uptake outer membrane protein [Marinilabilia rubra]PWE00619.1 RagB/SusD family nutrient uptake outer membrane protein [Marinilabilia rubra]